MQPKGSAQRVLIAFLLELKGFKMMGLRHSSPGWSQTCRPCPRDVKLVVVGPEDPLADGLCDDMTKAGIRCFGPSAGAAMLEVSKAFSKDFMQDGYLAKICKKCLRELRPARHSPLPGRLPPPPGPSLRFLENY